MTIRKISASAFVALPLLAVAFASFSSAGNDAPREPIVLNGHLNMSDFNGGVGYGISDAAPYDGPSALFSTAPRSQFSRTLAFVSAARIRALHGASMHGHGFGR
jgi:hypothetical protein